MIFLIIGFIAFLLFFLYDINSIMLKKNLLKCCFFIGVLLLVASLAGIIFTSWEMIRFTPVRSISLGVLAALCFVLLIYTLFFALPFQSTYVKTNDPPEICKRGVYALCRHPGVLWFAGFYFFLGFALMIRLLLAAAVIFSLLNLIYVVFQDRWTFMKSMKDYGEYKTDTPFLIPTLKSIKQCMRTIAEGKEH